MNPYERLATDFARLVNRGKKLPLGKFSARRQPVLSADAAGALIFSPHPDDECIVGALPLRLRREPRMNVINVAVTLGSKQSRRRERRRELERACACLGFNLILSAPNGLEQITPESRKANRRLWNRSVEIIADIIARENPRIIFAPHEHDGHPTHIGTHFLVLDALAAQPRRFECRVIETEFWRPMENPNLMVESGARDVGALMTALTFHAGEVRRNPYHLLLPAWMQDNVRRGAELVGGQGGKAPNFSFATLYRQRRWSRGKLKEDHATAAIIHAEG
jgi:LmbE family N-acetylglucosaminyl deacetylase